MHRFSAALPAALLFLSGCGYMGGPQPPLANIPSAVTDLAALQRGGTIIAHFTIPVFTTERLPIRDPLTFDLRVGEWPEHAAVEGWAAVAQRMPAPTLANGLATYQIPAAAWAGKEVVIAARVIGANGKESAWSNYWVLPVVAPPDPPRSLQASAAPDGVRLTWTSSSAHFRVLRTIAGQTPYAVVAPDVAAHEWTDTQTVAGTTYSYLVQAVVSVGEGKEAESELTEVKFTAQAPQIAAPAGLVAVPAPSSIELAWEAPAGDVAGYRIYRSVGGGALEKIADSGVVPSYSDHAVEHGKTYRYTVAALDADGHEGARSEVREVLMP